MAAVLACGPLAVLSHRAAAALHELRTAPSTIEVTTPKHRAVTGLACHTSRCLTVRDRTVVDGIPVTSINRTLLDIAAGLHRQRLRSTLEAVQRRNLLRPEQLNDLLERSNGHRAVTPLRTVLAELHDEAPWTQSKLEQRFLELIRDAGLPEPQTNVLVDGELVDCFWPEHNLVVELDGYGFHRGKRQFELDRAKDTKHTLAGRRSARITRARVEHEPLEMLNDVSALLGRATGASGR
jgi:very-short-patch-repair endonuclease